ncbi:MULTISPECIES: phenolic acid decarboxylase [unclassified Cryobacterium]|uniref:phenolic acid decarboxylase n=2 Tax=Cryobacterium TaxID=69578 RepID=UPI002AB4DC35|nr:MULTISPECIES: phenolic acid decarboxylase [unclassified Cryobacterium]MDY7542934.1 phenolic acid decarboxylase [Cryobacterium sp. 5B3]MEB0265393.1 phenolic acid decarboxylase [Cryobacterium sp. 10I5]MEB0274913.1 phenolic acid decarboxylase [Cryobacterium sp. 5B3]
MTSTPNMSQDTVTTVAQPTPPQDLSGIVGYRFIYTYANNWQYEMYVKNATTMDYRIHTGMVGGRWVTDQTVDLVQLDDSVYKVSWTEPTGTSVVVNVLPAKRRLHGTIFFPRWIEEAGSKTVLYQNDHLDEMRAFRDAGPTYPIYVVPEFARITLFEFVGENDDTVVSTAPNDLPAGFADRTN